MQACCRKWEEAPNMATTTDEQDLRDMRRLATGQEVCLDALIGRHGPSLFRFLVRVLGNANDAEEVAQESFVKVYQNRGRFNPQHRFTSWLYRIATNLARDRLRRSRRRHELPFQGFDGSNPGPHPAEPRDPGLDPLQSLAATEAGGLVRAAVQSLPEDLRIPIILAEYEELTHAEIGSVVGCTAKAVEMRLYRARQALRKMLKPLLVARCCGPGDLRSN